MRIIGPPSASIETVRGNLAEMEPHGRFIAEMLQPCWDAAADSIIDPVGAVAQMYKETGGGYFRGRVQAWFYNPCGLKVRNVQGVMQIVGTTDVDHPLVHQQFPNWDVGCRAHIQHLRAYAGWPVEFELMQSPRAHYVKHRVSDWYQLGGPGSWAPSHSYGQEIEMIMKELQA